MRIAFKPIATIIMDQDSIDNKGDIVKITGKGRHDPCVVPRAVPIVEAMAAITILDFYLRNKAIQL
jgi:chorismate synthase